MRAEVRLRTSIVVRGRWWWARLTAAAVITLGLGAVPASGSTAAGDESCVDVKASEAEAVAEAVRCGHRVRVAGLTSETFEAWALPSRLIEATVSAGVARVRRGDEWVPLDLTLTRRADGSVVPVAHPNDLVISGVAPAGEHDLAAVGRAGARVAVGWSGPLPEPVLAGSRATFVDALPGVDVVVEATPEGFEQSYVVKSRAAVDRVRELTLPFTGANVAAHAVEPDGTVVLRNAAGGEVARVPTPWMWDSRPALPTGEPARSMPVRPQAAPRASPATWSGDGGVTVTLAPDAAWMLDAGTVFPVVIDPTVSPVSSTFSTMVVQGSDADRSAKTDMWIGLMGGSSPGITRSFVHWPATTFAGRQIVSARTYFWNFYSNTCAPTAWEIWSTGPTSATTYWSTQPLWIDADSATPGDQPEATSTETRGFDASCNDNWASADARSFFQRAADAGQTTAYMGIRAADETTTAGFKQFYTQNHATTSVRPYATVTYNSYPQVTARTTVPSTSCVVGPTRPAIQTMTPTLQATVSDPEGSAMSVQFQWRTLDGAADLGAATVSSVAPGGSASATVPAGSLPRAGSYRWRVVVSDGAGSTTSSWCEFTAYQFAPPADGCAGTVDDDLDGDGVRDTVIADPQATVDGAESAGAVYVVSGATGAVTTIDQDVAEVPDTAEPGDGFGTAIAVYDANRDGCADLAVGAPYEDVGTVNGSGGVWVLMGSRVGLGKGPAAVTLQQGMGGFGETPEADDWFGYSMAAGTTTAGDPYLIVGAPGEDIGSASDAGMAFYLRGTAVVTLVQGSGGIPGSPEIDDRFGYSVTGSPGHVAVGVPGESIGSATWAGAVDVFTHQVNGTALQFAVELHQDATGVSLTASSDDQFGRAIDMAAYRPAGATQVDSLLVVGVPGEDNTVEGVLQHDAGLVHRFHLAGTSFTEMPAITDQSEDGDAFGEQLMLINTDPGSESNGQNVLLAVGAPGEDRTAGYDVGVVRVFAAAANPVPEAVHVERGAGGLPGSPIEGELLGLALGGNGEYLFVASPYKGRVVYALTWSALAAGSAVVARTWQSGQGGFPAGGVSFGAAVR